jgi:hypothetical protein
VTLSSPPVPSQDESCVCVKALQTEQLEHSAAPAAAYWPAAHAEHELVPAAEDTVAKP